MAPLWLMIATGPSAGAASRNIVEKLATAPEPKFARPCEFGPTTRIPAALALATMRRSAEMAAGSWVSPKPEAITTATRTPRAAQSRTACSAWAPGVAMIAMSGTSGTAAMSGYARRPCTCRRLGLIG